MLACLVSGLANGAFWSLAPVFTAGVSDKVSLAAGFMTGAVIGGAAGQWPLGIWSDRVDRRIVIAAASVVSALVGIALWWLYAGLSITALIALSAAWGAVAFPLYSVAVAHSNDFAEAGEYVMVSGGLLLMYGIGAIVGPFLAAAAMTLLADSVLYAYTAIMHLLLFGYVLLRLPRRASAPLEQHVPFAEALTSVQTASQVFEEEQEERKR
jgi:MFS family permease